MVARPAADWVARVGEDELAASVLADRRALWGTPTAPLPMAEGEARVALLDASATRAFARALATGFDANAVLTEAGATPG